MATKVYTAQEMREIANALSGDNEDLEDLVIADADYGLHINHNKTFEVASMLRQAADALEREEKREVKYEYAERNKEGRVYTYHKDDIKDIDMLLPGSIIVRRPVGEWEEVK